MGFAIPAAMIGSSLLNAAQQSATNEESQDFAREMYERQRRDALTDAQMQNIYNSPAEQMKRLLAAGLNPNLVYGNGATQNAAPVRSSSVESWKPQAPQIDLASGLMAGVDAEYKQAQTDNVKAATDVAKEQAMTQVVSRVVMQTQARKNLTETERIEQDMAIARALAPYSLEGAQLANRKTEADITKTTADTRYTLNQDERASALNASSIAEATQRILSMRMQNAKTSDERKLLQQQISNQKLEGELRQLDINLKKLGIQPGDNLFMRMLGQLLQKIMSGSVDLPSMSFPKG